MNQNRDNTAFYLKINKNTDFALKYLERWIQVAYLFDRDCYIICDNMDVAASILDKDILYGNTTIIESISEDQAKTVAQRFSGNDHWLGAALAHMSTFYHSQKHGYDYFWNIDADDTFVCLSVDRIKEMLEKCEDYAKFQASDCLSLDMWRSIYKGGHWSFGITFTSNDKDWIQLMECHSLDAQFLRKEARTRGNIDSFFTYLKEALPSLRIDTFYFENLTFIHDSENFVMHSVEGTIYHWIGGELHLPLVEHCFKIPEIGTMRIADDVIKFGMDIKDEEAASVLCAYVKSLNKLCNINRYIDFKYLLNPRIALLKQRQYIRSCVKNAEVVLFGAGKVFYDNQKNFRECFGAKYVADNDPLKWGKTLGEGVQCISPGELCKIENVFVLITIISRPDTLEIKKQLEDMGIKHYDSFFGNNFTNPARLI